MFVATNAHVHCCCLQGFDVGVLRDGIATGEHILMARVDNGTTHEWVVADPKGGGAADTKCACGVADFIFAQRWSRISQALSSFVASQADGGATPTQVKLPSLPTAISQQDHFLHWYSPAPPPRTRCVVL